MQRKLSDRSARDWLIWLYLERGHVVLIQMLRGCRQRQLLKLVTTQEAEPKSSMSVTHDVRRVALECNGQTHIKLYWAVIGQNYISAWPVFQTMSKSVLVSKLVIFGFIPGQFSQCTISASHFCLIFQKISTIKRTRFCYLPRKDQ